MQPVMWETISAPSPNDLLPGPSNTYSDQILAPIHKLPPELLSDIFLTTIVIDQRHDYPPVPFLVTKRPPFIFCHVCRLWRFIALQTPRLWSSFTIRGKFNDRMLSEAKFWTKLSSSTPLSFFLNIFGKPTEQADQLFNDIAPVLSAHINRWWFANVAARTTNQLEWAVSTLPKASETLENFTITCPNDQDDPPSLEVTSYPRLQYLVVDASVRMSLKHAEMPHLKFLVLTHPINAEEGLQLVKNCPSLRSCNIVFKDWMDPNPPEQFEHPSLGRLQLQSNNIGQVLDCMRLPKLHTLFLNDNDGPQSHFHPLYFNNFCELSFSNNIDTPPTSAPLTELTINGTIMSDRDVLQALRYLPDLEILTVNSIPLSNEILALALIDPVANSVILCPKLKKLTWFGARSTCTPDFIAKVLCARWDRMPYTLTDVTLEVGPFTVKDFEDEQYIKTALDSGAVTLTITPINRR